MKTVLAFGLGLATFAFAGCLTATPVIERIGCDAGAAGGPVRNCASTCEAPPHGTVDLVQEPDGTVTCLWGACEPGWLDCDGNPENGCEANLLSPTSCGDCGIKCTNQQTCEGSTAAGLIRCVFTGDGGGGNPTVPDGG